VRIIDDTDTLINKKAGRMAVKVVIVVAEVVVVVAAVVEEVE